MEVVSKLDHGDIKILVEMHRQDLEVRNRISKILVGNTQSVHNEIVEAWEKLKDT
jgi:hypothetical protein